MRPRGGVCGGRWSTHASRPSTWAAVRTSCRTSGAPPDADRPELALDTVRGREDLLVLGHVQGNDQRRPARGQYLLRQAIVSSLLLGAVAGEILSTRRAGWSSSLARPGNPLHCAYAIKLAPSRTAGSPRISGS